MAIMATQVETKIASLVSQLKALEEKLAEHLEAHEEERREWEEHERSMLEEVGAESLEEFEERELCGAGTSRLDAIMASTNYDEWLRVQEED